MNFDRLVRTGPIGVVGVIAALHVALELDLEYVNVKGDF